MTWNDPGAGAKAQLESVVARGRRSAFTPQGAPSSDRLRRSAVLILFGAQGRAQGLPESAPGTGPAGLDLLLTRRSETMRHHPGQIAFPGGGVEPGDRTMAETALREASEETGLDPAGVEVIGELPELHVPVSSNLVTPVIGWWRLPSDVAADRRESVEVMRVPVAELLDPAARGVSVLDRGGMRFRGAAFELDPRFGGHIVWGFTGMLLSSLFDDVGWTRPWDASRTFEVFG